MSRVSAIEQLIMASRPKKKFDYERLSAIPISCLFTESDIQELIRIATSIRYTAKIDKKYELIDQIMRMRGFVKVQAGTNRLLYRFLEDTSFMAKVAVDKVGMEDSPREYINQTIFQPFCCKIFEVHPSGEVAFIEPVNPITSLEEFISVKDDIFDLMTMKIVGKYVVDDLGTYTFMNFGVRPGFGPVIIDFPYVYELDPEKLICRHPVKGQFGILQPCMGEIDIIPGFNGYRCTKCGREYRARDLAKPKSDNFNPYEWDKHVSDSLRKVIAHFRAKVVDTKTGQVILDSGHKSDLYLSREELDLMQSYEIPEGPVEVGRTIYNKRVPPHERRLQYYSELQKKAIEQQMKTNQPKIADIINGPSYEVMEVARTIKSPLSTQYDQPIVVKDDYEDTLGLSIEDVIIEDESDKPIIHDRYMGPFKVVGDTSVEQFQDPYKPEPVEPQPIANIGPIEQKSITVVPDDVVQAMVDENAARSVEVEENSSGDEGILDPEADKDLTNNPMARPYTMASDTVNVLSKMEAKVQKIDAPKVNLDSLIQPNAEPSQSPPEPDPESEKGMRKADYERRKKNPKQRNPYDEEEE